MEALGVCPAGNTLCLSGVDQYILKNDEVSNLLDSIHNLRSGNQEESLKNLYKRLKSKEAENKHC